VILRQGVEVRAGTSAFHGLPAYPFHLAASTLSLSSTALVTAASVDTGISARRQCSVKALALDARGFGDFRDSPSLHNPAQSDQQYAGSLSSSNAALRYCTAKSGLSRSWRIGASSCEICPFPAVLEITERLLDVRGLFAFVATGKELVHKFVPASRNTGHREEPCGRQNFR
jgi:hypothetical protein